MCTIILIHVSNCKEAVLDFDHFFAIIIYFVNIVKFCYVSCRDVLHCYTDITKLVSYIYLWGVNMDVRFCSTKYSGHVPQFMGEAMLRLVYIFIQNIFELCIDQSCLKNNEMYSELIVDIQIMA